MAQLLATGALMPDRAEWQKQCLQRCCDAASFYMDDFIRDLNTIANAIHLFSALCTLYFDKDDTLARQLYHPESLDDEGVPAFGLANNKIAVNSHSLRWLADLFPKMTSKIAYDGENKVIGIAYEQDSVFDIAWNALAELAAATFGQQPYSKVTAIIKCGICGHYFIRKHPNQRYCGSAECEKIRNRRKALRYKHGDY